MNMFAVTVLGVVGDLERPDAVRRLAPHVHGGEGPSVEALARVVEHAAIEQCRVGAHW